MSFHKYGGCIALFGWFFAIYWSPLQYVNWSAWRCKSEAGDEAGFCAGVFGVVVIWMRVQ